MIDLRSYLGPSVVFFVVIADVDGLAALDIDLPKDLVEDVGVGLGYASVA